MSPVIVVTRGLTGDIVRDIDPFLFCKWGDVIQTLSSITEEESWRHQLWVGKEQITDIDRLRQIEACTLILDSSPERTSNAFGVWDMETRNLAVSPVDFEKYNRGPFTRARAQSFFHHVCEQEVLLETLDITVIQSSWKDTHNDNEDASARA